MSRRCTQREFLLRPDKECEEIVLYCLAEAARRFDITLHAWIAMSNHQHLVVRDNRGNYPEFLAHLNKNIAKAMNAHRGRWENFWATEQPNVVYLVGAEDRFDKIVYVLTNAVTADLVDEAAHWPGACSLNLNLSGRVVKIRRPRGFFRDEGPMPDFVELRAERPAGFEHLTHAEWSELLLKAIRTQEAAARAQRIEGERSVLGRKAVLAVEPTSRPSTPEPRRNLRPCVACKNRVRRHEELKALRGFHAAYRSARKRWGNGEHTATFPAGTYAMLRWKFACADLGECVRPS